MTTASPTLPALVVKPRDGHGGGERGVFAAADIRAGAFLGTFDGAPVAAPTRLSLQVGAGLHIEPAADCPLAFLNHSCAPAAAFTGRALHAVRDIPAGAEITIDYTCHEAAMTAPFDCRCGAPGCLGRVAGWATLTPAQREARRGRTASWLDPASP